MTTRGNVGGGVLTIAMTAALWAWSGGVASAQTLTCGGIDQPACPSPIVTCDAPEGAQCDGPCRCPSGAGEGVYQPGQNVAKVFKFGSNNSIQVKFDQVTCPLVVSVELVPTMQAVFQPRVTSEADGGVCPFTTEPRPYPPTPDISCNETVDMDGWPGGPVCRLPRVIRARHVLHNGSQRRWIHHRLAGSRRQEKQA